MDDKWYSKKVQLNTLKNFCSEKGNIDLIPGKDTYFSFRGLFVPNSEIVNYYGCGIQNFNIKFNSIDISIPLDFPATYPESVISHECNCKHCNITFSNTLSTDMGVLVNANNNSRYNNLVMGKPDPELIGCLGLYNSNTTATNARVLILSPEIDTNVFYTNNKKAYVKDGQWIVEEIS